MENYYLFIKNIKKQENSKSLIILIILHNKNLNFTTLPNLIIIILTIIEIMIALANLSLRKK